MLHLLKLFMKGNPLGQTLELYQLGHYKGNRGTEDNGVNTSDGICSQTLLIVHQENWQKKMRAEYKTTRYAATQTTELAGEFLCEHTNQFDIYIALHHENNTTGPNDCLSFYTAKMGIHWTIYILLHEVWSLNVIEFSS